MLPNLSELYRLDAFDWTILLIYFGILLILTIYGIYKTKQVFAFWRYGHLVPQYDSRFSEEDLPHITVQLPIFNELYVVDRLLKAITDIDYPHDKLEIQVLDDSTDETTKIARALAERYGKREFKITYIHRNDRLGFRAGALSNGLDAAEGEFLAIFDADFVPKADCLRKLVHFFTDPVIGCVQMRWSHINRSYNLLTILQSIVLDGNFVVEQAVRNRSGFFEYNGTAALWRRKTIDMSGGWQSDTLAEDVDLSFRAQLLGWKFIYLLHEDVPGEIPVEINAVKAQQRRLVKGAIQVGRKLFRRILFARLPRSAKVQLFFRLAENMLYPLVIVAAFLQFPLLLVRYNQPFQQLMLFDLPILLFLAIAISMFYGSSIWFLDQGFTTRLLYVPLVGALAIGFAFSNTRAVLEALLGVQTQFVRTPKYRIEEATDQSWKRKKYRRKRGLLPLLELSFAVYVMLCTIYAVRMEMWGAMPVLILFLFGFGYSGIMSLFQSSTRSTRIGWR